MAGYVVLAVYVAALLGTFVAPWITGGGCIKRGQHQWTRLGYGGAGWSTYRCDVCGLEDIG